MFDVRLMRRISLHNVADYHKLQDILGHFVNKLKHI